MYKVIGNDGKIYGPIPLEMLRQWVAEGRVNSETLIQPEGATDWRPLSSFALFAAPPPVTPPPPAAPVVSASPPDLATAGLISALLGCVCCCCGTPFALLGLILSIIALMETPGRNRGVALAGLILSILVLGMHLLVPLLKLAAIPWFIPWNGTHHWN